MEELLDEVGEDDDYQGEDEDEDEEEGMDLETLKKIRRSSAMSVSGTSSDEMESHSPIRMAPLRPPLEQQMSELQMLAPPAESWESERSRPSGLGIHPSGRKISKSRSRSTSPKKGGTSKR